MNIGTDGFSLWPLSRPAPKPDCRESLNVKDLLDDERLRRMLTN